LERARQMIRERGEMLLDRAEPDNVVPLAAAKKGF
jgi:hypothetical protein